MKTLKQQIGDRLRDLRNARGWKQRDVAIKIGVSDKAVSSYELGDTAPSPQHLIDLARVYSVTTDYLLMGDDSTGQRQNKS